MIALLGRLLSWRWLPYIGIVILLGLVGMLANRSCDYSEARVLLEEHVRDLEIEIRGLEKVRARQDTIIAEKDVELERIRANAGKPTEAERAKDKTIAVQLKEIARLKANADYKAALEIAEVALREQAEKFTLAETRHANALSALDAAWQTKFDAQVVISESWKRQWEGERAVRIETGKALLKAEAALRWERLKFKGAGLVAIAASGYLAYRLIAEKK